MTPKQIDVENLGPIAELSVKLDGYGITVLSAPNGSGKSIFLDAAGKLAGGKGKLPLRDHARRGKISGCGATITIGHSTRYAGEFEVEHLEGRFDLAELVDPKLKSPTAADKRRIKALVGLTGVKADLDLFASHEAFSDILDVVQPETIETDDLVEMAANVKRAYETHSRASEKEAERGFATANGMTLAEAPEACETDADTLQAALERAVADKVKVTAAVMDNAMREQQAAAASDRLEDLLAEYDGPSVEQATEDDGEAAEDARQASVAVDELRHRLAQAKTELAVANGARSMAATALTSATHHASLVAECRTLAESALPERIPTERVTQAIEAVEAARVAVEQGAMAREAVKRAAEAKRLKADAIKARTWSERYREAARSTDEVLSSAIQCDALRIESSGGESRLVVDHPRRGNGIPYHELSEGERWKIAIELGADQVGVGGILVIPQVAWESLDAFVRPIIHAKAIERQVYVLTAEATRAKEDGDGLVVKQYAEVNGD